MCACTENGSDDADAVTSCLIPVISLSARGNPAALYLALSRSVFYLFIFLRVYFLLDFSYVDVQLYRDLGRAP